MSLINREDLIAEYDRVHVGEPGGARKLMVDAPEVKPEPNWIPVSEKAHPTKEGRYLVTDDAGGIATVDVDDFVYCDDGSEMWLCSQNVTAWMPLPEPYKENK